MQVEVLRTEKVIPELMPRGTYHGTWCGFEINVPCQEGGHWNIRTKNRSHGCRRVEVEVGDFGEISVNRTKN